MMKQVLTRHQARWALFLSCFHFTIVHQPGVQNKSDALSRHPDHKEGIALGNEEHVLLHSNFFSARAAHPTAVTALGDLPLKQQIKSVQEYDKEVSIALESILKNGPRSITRGLEDWNLEDGVILYRGQVYVPKDETL
jgi:hypothetical protein